MSGQRQYPFAIDDRYARLLRLWGVQADTSGVEVDQGRLEVRFGRLRLVTETANVLDARVDGPYRAHRVIGPHLSLADRGVTFGTNVRAGVCVRFARPVPALLGRLVEHPNLTVTVADVEGLATALAPTGAE